MNDDTLQQIQQYLDQQLPEAERAAFEERAKAEPELQARLREELMLRKSIQAAATAGQRQLYEQAEASFARMRRLQFIGLAAAALALIIMGAWIFRGSSASPEQLYAEYFGDPPLEPRFQLGAADRDWMQALMQLEQQNYVEAISLLEQLTSQADFPHLQAAKLYLAQCHLKQGNLEATQLALEAIPPDDPTYGFDAIWLRAMLHLRQNRVQQALPLLEQLRESRTYAARAQRLLTQLGA